MVTTQKMGLRKSLGCPLKEEGKKKNCFYQYFHYVCLEENRCHLGPLGRMASFTKHGKSVSVDISKTKRILYPFIFVQVSRGKSSVKC